MERLTGAMRHLPQFAKDALPDFSSLVDLDRADEKSRQNSVHGPCVGHGTGT
jgi:hypothetical protein